jgi:hypothetical protein
MADRFGIVLRTVLAAKANNREPYRYLCWLFERLPTVDLDDCDSLMPWNMPKLSGVVS